MAPFQVVKNQSWRTPQLVASCRHAARAATLRMAIPPNHSRGRLHDVLSALRSSPPWFPRSSRWFRRPSPRCMFLLMLSSLQLQRSSRLRWLRLPALLSPALASQRQAIAEHNRPKNDKSVLALCTCGTCFLPRSAQSCPKLSRPSRQFLCQTNCIIRVLLVRCCSSDQPP